MGKDKNKQNGSDNHILVLTQGESHGEEDSEEEEENLCGQDRLGIEIMANKLLRQVRWPTSTNDHEEFCDEIKGVVNRQTKRGIQPEAIAEYLHNHLLSVESVGKKYSNEIDCSAPLTLDSVIEALRTCDKASYKRTNVEKFSKIIMKSGEDIEQLTRRVARKYKEYGMSSGNDKNENIRRIREQVCKAAKLPCETIELVSSCFDLETLPKIIVDEQEKTEEQADWGYEKLNQNRYTIMCTNCRRFNHQKQECKYKEYCSLCRSEGHSDSNHFAWLNEQEENDKSCIKTSAPQLIT